MFALVDRLSQKDAVLAQALTEKLQLFADLAESVIGPEDTASRSRLLLRGDAPDLQQGEALLKGAITEGTMLLHESCVFFTFFRSTDQWLCVRFPNLLLISILDIYLCASVENLQNLLQSRSNEEASTSRPEDGSGSGALPRRAVTFGGYDSNPTVLSKSASHTVHALKKSAI